jgi:DNA-directed RNA polymerase subunit RPC12/RpoP
MDQKFIPWPDYSVCPKCKTKVDAPSKWGIFRKQPETKTLTCPNCGTKIDHIIPGHALNQRHSVE